MGRPGVAWGFALAVTLITCRGGGDAPQRTTVDRRIFGTAWDTVAVFGGETDDTLLLIPRLLASRGARLVVYDYGDHRLKVFDRGRLVWTFGGKGKGPGEFGNALDLEISRDGRIWLVDSGLGRLTAVESSDSSSVLPLRGIMARDVVPLPSEVLITSVSASPEFLVAFDSAGAVAGRQGFPSSAVAEAQPLVRQTNSALGDDGLSWATIFPFGNDLFVYRGREHRCSGKLVEGQPFPKEGMGPGIPVWGVAVVVTDSTAAVLARGETEHALQVLDHYSLDDCRYVGSELLPRKVYSLAYGRGIYYVGYDDPVPTVAALRPRR